MVYGDERPYNVCMIIPDFAALGRYARENRLPENSAQLIADTAIEPSPRQAAGNLRRKDKKAISSSLANPAASGEECARYRGSKNDCRRDHRVVRKAS